MNSRPPFGVGKVSTFWIRMRPVVPTSMLWCEIEIPYDVLGEVGKGVWQSFGFLVRLPFNEFMG